MTCAMCETEFCYDCGEAQHVGACPKLLTESTETLLTETLRRERFQQRQRRPRNNLKTGGIIGNLFIS